MTDVTSSGRQLFFDLIAAAASNPSQSSVEAAAWDAAGNRAHGDAAAPTVAEPADPTETATPVKPAPQVPVAAGDDRPASTPMALRLVDADEEPPLRSPAAGPAEGALLGPGPRIAAFAAATGAAVTATPGADSGQRQDPNPGGRRRQQPNARPEPATGAPKPTRPEQPAPQVEADPAGRPSARVSGVSGQAPPNPKSADQAGLGRGVVTIDPASIPPIAPAEPKAEPTTPKPPTAAAVVHDDDFGPLVLPDPPRRRRARLQARDDGTSRPHKPTRKRARSAGIAGRRATVGAFLLAGVLAAAGIWLLIPQRGTPTASQAPAASMVEWRGMWLPVAAAAGPAELTETRAAGFSQSPLGAAIAAAHLSVRIDPTVGPTVFEPVLTDQVLGARDRLAKAVRAQHTSGTATAAGEPGTLLGWRLDGDPSLGQVVAHVAVQHGDGSQADYAVSLAWSEGDWRLQAPETGAFFPVTGLTGNYEPFAEGAAQ